jgi:hypothetical protein
VIVLMLDADVGFWRDQSPVSDPGYAADMFDRLLELEPSLSAARSPAQRILGCCRDFCTLYVSMLRHHQIPSQCRVGFAGCFDAGWWIDMWWSRSGTAGKATAARQRSRAVRLGSGQGTGLRVLVAGIIGAGRWWTVWMISVLSIPRRYAEVIPEVGMAELALDHQQRDGLAGHLDRMRMPELEWREAAANPGGQRGVAQLAADPGR